MGVRVAPLPRRRSPRVRGTREAGAEAAAGAEPLGPVGGRAVAQERGHVGVVLQAGEDYVQLHPLEPQTQTHTDTLKHTRVHLEDARVRVCRGVPVLWRDSPIDRGLEAAKSEEAPSSPSAEAAAWWPPPTESL